MQKLEVSNSRIFNDLVEYTKLPPELVLKRFQYAATELSIVWTKKKSVTEFYESTDLYLFDLTMYQLMLEHHKLIQEMVQQIKEIAPKAKVLEFGGGIGEFSLICSENNIDCTYTDIGQTKEYAVWRFNKHKQRVKIIESDPLKEKWDFVNIMDVLEHLENSEEIIEKLGKTARYIFCNPTEIKYNRSYPQHISKYDLTKQFIHVKRYLWKNKNEHPTKQ